MAIHRNIKKPLKFGLFFALGIVLVILGVMVYKKQKSKLGALKKTDIFGYNLYLISKKLDIIKEHFQNHVNISKYDDIEFIMFDYCLPVLRKFFKYPKEDEKWLMFQLAQYLLGHKGTEFETGLNLLAYELALKN